MRSFIWMILFVFSIAVSPVQAATFKVVAAEIPPYAMKTEGGARGILVDMAREAFEGLGHKVEFRFYPWPRAIETFKRGHADFILPFFKSAERETFARFEGDGLIDMELMFFKRAGTDYAIADFGDVHGLRVAKVRRANLGPVFQKARDEHLFDVEEAGNTVLALKMLKAGRVDLMANVKDIVVFSALRENMSQQFEPAGPTFGVLKAFMACARENLPKEMCRAIAQVGEAMKEDGRARDIQNRYLLVK